MTISFLYRAIPAVDNEFRAFLTTRLTPPLLGLLFGVEVSRGVLGAALFDIPAAPFAVRHHVCRFSRHAHLLIQKTADGSRWTVEQMLTEALAEVAEQRTTPTKALVLFLDDADGQYDVGFRQSGLTMSQALALTHVAQSVLLREMGY